VADPFRAPLRALSGVLAPVGSLVDKLRVAMLRLSVTAASSDELLAGGVGTSKKSTEEYLGERFTPDMIDKFFRPFYQGIFLAPLGEQSARMFAFVFQMFSQAPAALPARGIGAVADQLAASLPRDLVSIELNQKVSSLSDTNADVVIVATDGPSAARLLADVASANVEDPGSRGSICLYFSSNSPAPIQAPILVLNGNGGGSGSDGGVVNNMFFPTNVCDTYAPPGRTLISTTIVGDELGKSDEELEALVRSQMSQWFGDAEVERWSFIRSYRIPHSQPFQHPEAEFEKPARSMVSPGLFVCGDYRNTPTFNGALVSGRLAAEEAINYLETVASNA
jgi:protoporphyrinogen oxidase